MHFNRNRKRTIRKSAAALLAVTQSVMPAFAAAAGVWEVKDGDWMYKGEDPIHGCVTRPITGSTI